MANVFKRQQDINNNPKRNKFDMSFQNNLTMEFGKSYPVMMQEVLPGDSISIKPTFGFSWMPLVFPVQTRIKSYLHFFYVRNRTLWKDWEDFIFNTKPGLEPPYIDFNAGGNFNALLGKGGFADYLGLPNFLVGSAPTTQSLVPFNRVQLTTTDIAYRQGVATGTLNPLISGTLSYAGPNGVIQDVLSNPSLIKIPSAFFYGTALTTSSSRPYTYAFQEPSRQPGSTGPFYFRFSVFEIPSPTLLQSGVSISLTPVWGNTSLSSSAKSTALSRMKVVFFNMGSSSSSEVAPFTWSSTISVSDPDAVQTFTGFSAGASFTHFAVFTASGRLYADNLFDSVNSLTDSAANSAPLGFKANFTYPLTSDQFIDENTSPYWGTGHESGTLKVSALPFRAYEAIYNCYYRNLQNDPFKINGVQEPNKLITTDAGGPDTTQYRIMYRQWSPDQYTTAVQSPQAGVAPLVGVSTNGTFSFSDDGGNIYKAQAEVDEDGDTIKSFKVLSEDMPQGNLRALVDMATSGISISDLRNVNSLQRWLEINLRKQFRYRDLLKGHFGVSPSYDTVQYPEFIGGVSRDTVINQIDQTSPAGDGVLGSYAGQASTFGTSKSRINCYCDEHGYIVGILSTVPMSNYSQVIPKHFIKRDCLDYYSPSFAKIGYQPIYNSEISPIQSYNEGSQNNVFGYQRAWYDYLQNIDQVHGLFRTELDDYLIQRRFASTPQLGSEFLYCKPDQVNQVFAVTDTTDKILGQLYFDIVMKRPIPIVSVPSLE